MAFDTGRKGDNLLVECLRTDKLPGNRQVVGCQTVCQFANCVSVAGHEVDS